MSFKKTDLSQYNTAHSPWYNVSLNGKIDIGYKIGDGNKISLTPEGMYRMVNEWLNSNTGLSTEQKENLISKLEN